MNLKEWRKTFEYILKDQKLMAGACIRNNEIRWDIMLPIFAQPQENFKKSWSSFGFGTKDFIPFQEKQGQEFIRKEFLKLNQDIIFDIKPMSLGSSIMKLPPEEFNQLKINIVSFGQHLDKLATNRLTNYDTIIRQYINTCENLLSLIDSGKFDNQAIFEASKFVDNYHESILNSSYLPEEYHELTRITTEVINVSYKYVDIILKKLKERV